MGETGKGQKCKIANQITIGCNLVGLSEGLVFAEKTGLDLGKFLGATRKGSAYTKALELFGERMVEGDFRPGGFAEYMVKDLGMGVNVVEEREDGEVVVLPHASLYKQLFSSMVGNHWFCLKLLCVSSCSLVWLLMEMESLGVNTSIMPAASLSPCRPECRSYRHRQYPPDSLGFG